MKFKFRHAAALALVFAAAAEPYWATDEAHAAKTLEAANLTPTKIGHDSYGDYGWGRCGLSVYVTKFEATNAGGKPVTGYICSNPLSSGSTISFNNR